jgi:tRNA U54 and U55 pseudouridine synthase Pus10
LADKKIFCLPVAIYENIFLKKEVVRFVFDQLGKKDFDTKFCELEKELISKVKDTKFAFAYKKSKIQQLFAQEIDAIAIGKEFKPDFEAYELEIENLKSGTYEDILKKFNQKSMKECVKKLDFFWERWHTQVLNIFNTDNSNNFRNVFLTFMPDIK